MNLTIGSTTIAITSCIRERDTRRGFYLNIRIPEDSIGMDDLKNLFKDNQETITVTDDDGTTNMYMGFKLLSSMSLENGTYCVIQACVSEIEAQLSMAQNKVAAQAASLEATNQVVSNQAQQILAQQQTIEIQAQTIADQGNIIETQTQQIMVLEEQSMVQDETSIELYEANAVLTEQVVSLEDQVSVQEEANTVQEEANTVQDEALIELYELLEF